MVFRKLFLALFLILSANTAFADVAIDGSTTVTSANSISLTSTKSHVGVFVLSNNSVSTASITGCTDGKNLTWNKRIRLTLTGLTTEIWYAISPGKLVSDLVTCTYSSGTGGRLAIFAISGINLSAPFDPNGSLPATQTNASSQSAAAAITTTYANDLCFTFLRVTGSLGTLTAPSGYSQIIATGTAQDDSSKVYYAAQSSLSIAYSWTGTASTNSLIVDCVQASVPTDLLSTAF